MEKKLLKRIDFRTAHTMDSMEAHPRAAYIEVKVPRAIKMRRSKSLSISVDDIKSGRFEILAEFVRTNWPFKNRPSRAESLDIVARSLGYDDFGKAVARASEKVIVSDFFAHCVYDRFVELGYAPAEDSTNRNTRQSAVEDFFSGAMFLKNKAARDFVNTWPLELVGRWNYGSLPVHFGTELMSELEPLFEELWLYDYVSSNGFMTETIRTESAASLVASLSVGMSYEKISELKIGDFIDGELAESILQDVFPVFIKELLSVNSIEEEVLTKETGCSMKDLWRLPKNEQSFPSLYEHMRQHVKKNLLNRKAIDLFQCKRAKSGFYNDPTDFTNSSGVQEVSVDGGTFRMKVERNHLDSEEFRSYGCVGQLKNCDGIILSQLYGTYVHAPARQDISGMDFISALDEVCDDDVEVGDLVLTALQSEILELDDEEVPKHSINVRLIFESGNLFILSGWERSERAEKGCGIELLFYVLSALKKKFKRNISVASIINPIQYSRSAEKSEGVQAQRKHDMGKIGAQLMQLQLHDAVVSLYIAGKNHSDGLSTFTQYCGAAYTPE
ncbi:TPA: hypothetical protein L4559_003518 [Pseudomonas aeruginosa]|nr:hypothetical protein [Pseudomonas aeruginosa]